MKFIFMLVLLVPVLCFGQQDSCSRYIVKTYDKISGNYMISNPDGFNIKNGKSQLSILMLTLNDRAVVYDCISLNFYIDGVVCCPDKENEINILFKDDTRITLYNNEDFNCKGHYEVYLGGAIGNVNVLTSLLSQKIEAIRLHAHQGFFDFDFDSTSSTKFFKQINCLSTYLRNR